MKKNVVVIIAVLIVIGITCVMYYLWQKNSNSINEENTYTLITNSGDCADNRYVVDEFLKVTQDGNTATLTITDDKTEETQEIVFDGKNYLFNNGIKSQSYLYFYTVTGRSPNAELEGTNYILSDIKYSFNQISKSILSSNSDDHLEYILICYTYN